jgi:gamma-glutamylcyclotransferase (GGCT)/AIG2-like uncharacterized protein YtfP
MITDLFVYGTLKRGECRESMWPRKPTRIREAFVRARLYDLGAYPAIRVDALSTEDDVQVDASRVDQCDDLDWVAGEVWSFESDVIDETLAALDEIEETNQPGTINLYDHVLVRAYDRPGSSGHDGGNASTLALAYQYSDDRRLSHLRRLRPTSGASFVGWSASRDR